MGEVGNVKYVKLSSYFLTDRLKAVVLLWIFFVMCVLCTILSVPCSLELPAGKRLALLFGMFLCVIVTFPVSWARCGS